MEIHDPYESCPFNIMHRILRSRMQFHIATCAQNHKHLDMEQCPFDARHVIKRVEFEHHKKTCPARESVLNYADHDAAKAQAELKILPIDVKPVGKWHEKWDKDPDVKTYNPIENIKNKPIVYPLIGVSKAKRIKHRLAERDRYNRVKEYSGNSFLRKNTRSESMNTSSKLSCLEVVYEIGDSTDEQGYSKPLRPPTKYIAANPIDKTVDKVAKEITKSPRCINPEKSSPISDIDETSNDSFSSASVSSSIYKKYTSSKVPSEGIEIFNKLPREFHVTAASTKNTEKHVIPDKISIASNKEKYQFDAYQNKSQQKFSVPDLLNMGSSMDDYQFEAHQYNDQEKCSITDAVSTVSSKDLYQFEPLQLKDQEISSVPDLIVEDKNYLVSYQDHDDEEESLISDYNTYNDVSSKDKYGSESYTYNEQNISASSKNNYQFMECQYKDYGKSSIADKVSVISSRDEYGFAPYQYKEQEKCSVPDIILSRDHHKFVPHQYEDYEKSSFTDTVSITSSKDDQYSEQGKCSIQVGPHKYRNYEKSTPDTFNSISNKDDRQFETYQYNDREKFSILDINSTFSQDKYLHKGPVESLSLTVDEISDTNSEYSYIEDDTAVLSETTKKVEDDTAVLPEKITEKNGEKNNYLMTDTVYDAFSDDESQYNVTNVSKNSNVTSPSSEKYETASESFSYKTAESSFSIDSSTTIMKPLKDVGIFEKIFQIFKDITVIDKGYKEKHESFNRVDPSKGKLFPRCGANFLNLK